MFRSDSKQNSLVGKTHRDEDEDEERKEGLRSYSDETENRNLEEIPSLYKYFQ